MAPSAIINREIDLLLDDMVGDVRSKLKGESFMEASVQAAINRFEVDSKNDGKMWTYPNQDADAREAVKRFVDDPNLRILSGMKKVKVGASGFIYRFNQYVVSEPSLWVDPANCFVVTGMSNKQWEVDMKKDAQEAIRDNIYHHGKLKKIEKKMKQMRNGVVVIDEIDTASKEWQLLHKILEPRMDLEDMRRRNNRFLFVSATMLSELKELIHWEGGVHGHMKLSIGANYIGHADFETRGIIRDSFPMNTLEDAERWVREDIAPYGTDYRVHIVRVRNKKMVEALKQACRNHRIEYLDHNSTDRLTEEQLNELYMETSRTRHVVLMVKGLLRRADLIPNEWKMRVGAVHELYVNSRKVSYDVQIQGLVGRMCGYWKDAFDMGHRAGPFRCNTDAIRAYEAKYVDPESNVMYKTNTKQESMLVHTKNVEKKSKASEKSSGNEPRPPPEVVELPDGFYYNLDDQFVVGMKHFDTYEENLAFSKSIGGKKIQQPKPCDKDPRFLVGQDFMQKPQPYRYDTIADWIKKYKVENNSLFPVNKDALKSGKYVRRYWVCYSDTTDPSTIQYVTAYIQKN